MIAKSSGMLMVSTAFVVLMGCQKQAAAPASEPAPVPVEAAPTAPQAAIPNGCNIMSADNWKASVNAQPPEKPRLTVSGRVVTNTGGYKVELAPLGTDLNPKIVTVRLTSTPPSGPAPQVVTTIDVPPVTVPGVQRELEKVVVLCGDGTLTEITDIPTTD